MELLALLKEKKYTPTECQQVLDAVELLQQYDQGSDYLIGLAMRVIREIDLGMETVLAILLQCCSHEEGFREQLKQPLPPVTLKIIEGLHQIPKVKQMTSQIETDQFRNLIISLVKDIRVILVKIVENYHLIQTVSEPAALLKISNEAKYIYAPLAHRLGLYRIKTQLEDLSLKNLQPKLYAEIAKKLNAKKAQRDCYIKGFVSSVAERLQGKIPEFEIKWRTKSIASIHNKIQKSNVQFEEIFDLYAMRIIIKAEEDEKTECWKAYSIVTDLYKPNPARLRDWLSIPKSNGYESLHTTVLDQENKWIEVQIRSERMNEIAEKGLAAHWKYKGGTEQQLDALINNVREILENPVSSSKELISEIQLENMSSEIYIFTPNGDLKTLRPNSTILDFAYEIHSQVGAQCIGGKIENRIFPIKHVLKNGDQVEIVTSKNQKPKQEWLKFVTTSRAKARIKNQLNQEKTESSVHGKELFVRRMKNWKYDYSEELVFELSKQFNYKTTIDFFYAIAQNKLDILKVKAVLDERLSKNTPVEQTNYSADQYRLAPEIDEDVLVIENQLSNVAYSFAKCCKPVLGDAVFGFTTISHGVKIHRQTCPNAKDMKERFPYRVMEVRWREGEKDNQQKGQKFQTTIKVTGDDQIGILGSITALIQKEFNTTIRSLNVNSDHGHFEAVLTIFVKDKHEINSICNRMLTIKGLEAVKRLDT